MGAIWFLFFQRQMVVFWMQRCLQKQWCETKPLFAEIAGPLLWRDGDWWQQHIRKTGKWRLGEFVCLLLLICLLTNHGTAAAPGPGSRAHRPHPLYNRRPGSGAPVQCRCSYWQHRSPTPPRRWQIFSNGPNIFRVWSPGLTSAAGHTSTVPRPPVVCHA